MDRIEAVDTRTQAAALAIDPSIGSDAFDGRPFADGSRIGKAVRLARAALAAADAVSVVPNGYRLVSQRSIDWLMGEGLDEDGLAFGEGRHWARGAFWWRRPFTEMIEAAPSSPLPTEAEIRADERRKCAQRIRDVAAAYEAHPLASSVDNPFAAAFCRSSDASLRKGLLAAADAITKEGKP